MPEEEHVHHGFFLSHPFGVGLSFAATLLAVGALIVSQRLGVAQVQQSGGWSGNILTLVDPNYVPPPETPDIVAQTLSTPPFTYQIPNLPYTGPAPAETESSEGLGSDEYRKIIEELAKSSAPTSTGPAVVDLSGIYSFIPSGLVSVQSEKQRTKDVQLLFNYGNELGSIVQSFEETHAQMVQILKDQVEDPTDDQKGAAVAQIGRDLERVGQDMEEMTSVPAQAAGMHAALAKSYDEMGKKLALIPNAKRPSDLLEAITAYNAAADGYAKNFISLALLFSTSGVSFQGTDPGSVFVFSNSTSL